MPACARSAAAAKAELYLPVAVRCAGGGRAVAAAPSPRPRYRFGRPVLGPLVVARSAARQVPGKGNHRPDCAGRPAAPPPRCERRSGGGDRR